MTKANIFAILNIEYKNLSFAQCGAGTNQNKNKMQNTANLRADVLGDFGWRYYNKAKKKAMEQEFSWSGLLLSLSIAFFIVLATAQLLSLAYKSIETTKRNEIFMNQRIYQLEAREQINGQAVESIKRIQLNNIYKV